jgi:mannosyltransferase OCH1-like enzyme
MNDFFEQVDYKINNDKFWQVFSCLYEKHFLTCTHKTQQIPKKIHQVWIGGHVPDNTKRLRDSWLKHNPDWEYKLWGDEDAENFGMINKSVFDKLTNKGARSDVFRYEIVCREGGVYADTDFECIKPFDDFLHLSFFGGDGYHESPNTFNGLFGSVPDHPILHAMINYIYRLTVKAEYGLAEILGVTGADKLTEILLKYLSENDDEVVIFPKNFFYPFPPELRFGVRNDTVSDQNLVHSYIKPRTHSIHYWYTSWQ